MWFLDPSPPPPPPPDTTETVSQGPTTLLSNAQPQGQEEDKLPVYLGGIAAGAVLVIFILALVLCICIKQRQRQNQADYGNFGNFLSLSPLALPLLLSLFCLYLALSLYLPFSLCLFLSILLYFSPPSLSLSLFYSFLHIYTDTRSSEGKLGEMPRERSQRYLKHFFKASIYIREPQILVQILLYVHVF